ncbi:MAG: mscL [Clostridiales bacterium]|jgi:large conductance mechanosensitive channel|nr:mscL [Clostridiales bacterium]
MLKEFKKFALKGNIIDLAVGVVIGGAFGKIVTSLVNDIIMPFLGIVMGKVSFVDLKWVIKAAEGDTAELAVRYGLFLQTMLDFLIIAFSIFIVIRLLMKFKKKEEAKPATVSASKEEVLLTEIRDLLKERK